MKSSVTGGRAGLGVVIGSGGKIGDADLGIFLYKNRSGRFWGFSFWGVTNN